MSMRLKDKVCIITGGGSGIGRATALLFAREGARLAIADKRKDAAQAVSQECARHGVAAIAIEMDVAKAADARRMVDETMKAFGRLDVLVNNAGTASPAAWWKPRSRRGTTSCPSTCAAFFCAPNLPFRP